MGVGSLKLRYGSGFGVRHRVDCHLYYAYKNVAGATLGVRMSSSYLV